MQILFQKFLEGIWENHDESQSEYLVPQFLMGTSLMWVRALLWDPLTWFNVAYEERVAMSGQVPRSKEQQTVLNMFRSYVECKSSDVSMQKWKNVDVWVILPNSKRDHCFRGTYPPKHQAVIELFNVTTKKIVLFIVAMVRTLKTTNILGTKKHWKDNISAGNCTRPSHFFM
jgi:hypothetical protein